jgi:hypothetical protein
LLFQSKVAFFVIFVGIFGSLLTPVFSLDFASATSDEEGEDTGGGGNGNNNGGSSTSTGECQGQADCFRGTVTEIVDGDTLDVNNVRVRLALVNTPENGYTEAVDFVQSVCGIGTAALVDEMMDRKRVVLIE